MGLFISVRVDDELCKEGNRQCLECVSLCPVNIFSEREHRLVVNEQREDECTLCELCLLAAPPTAVQVVKHYSGEVLMRMPKHEVAQVRNANENATERRSQGSRGG